MKTAAEFFLKLWLAGGAACVLAGWILSAFGVLGRTAYALLAVAGLSATVWFWRREDGTAALGRCRRSVQSCWRGRGPVCRWLPRLWLLGAAAALVSGWLHAPNNYDALAYRVPRVLHWLAEGRWHWISSPDLRLNYSATGFEWLMAPVLALARSDRLLFLLNWIPFLLLPPLVFAVFRRLGVRAAVAWHWMWLLPGGYCFLLQAGSIGNDAFAAVFLLAAIFFAQRAAQNRSARNLAWSVLAAALMTGAKASNLPLLLPWVVACWLARSLVLSRPVALATLLALGVSFLPQAVLNHRCSGHWGGDPANQERLRASDAATGLLGNSLQLAAQNLAPPFNPAARSLNERLTAALPSAWHQRLAGGFPRFTPGVGELAQEESAGVGLGVTLLAVAGIFFAKFRRGEWRVLRPGLAVAMAAWISLAVLATQLGSESTARLIAPYYPLLLALVLLLPAQDYLARRRWWRGLAVAVSGAALLVIVVTPSRPLWPAQTVLGWFSAAWPESQFVQRAARVYTVYAGRADSLAPLRRFVPPDANVLGFLSNGNEPETSLWRPLGGRRVVLILPGDDIELLRQRGVEYVVISSAGLKRLFGQTVEEWCGHHRARVLASQSLTLLASQGERPWHVVQLLR
ncbi:MAG: hypothetical protein HZA89_15160 [Verrucomicrobia bacterium]|nr:hypothetical protein [Verrucomicrobiota bacterium]